MSDADPVNTAVPGARYAELRSPYAVDLLQEEEPIGSGHTLRDHVTRSDQALKNRLETMRFSFGPLQGGYLRDGSFTSLEAANKLVNSTLHQNAPLVETVALGKTRFNVSVESYFASPTGYEAFKVHLNGQANIRDTFGVRVVIRHNGNTSNGFSVITAFPINR